MPDLKDRSRDTAAGLEALFPVEASSMTDRDAVFATEVLIPSDCAEGMRVQQNLIELMRQRNFSERDVFAVRLAVEEAIVNAIKHGNGMVREKQVRIRYEVAAQRIWIEIEDQGRGFRLEEVPDPTEPENLHRPCGRGILLMRTYMSSVEYNPRGNRVTLIKHRNHLPDLD